MTRVRYKTDPISGFMISNKPILCNSRFVDVIIMPKESRYIIQDCNTAEILFDKVSINVTQLKKDAKNSLKSIGATFFDEVRGKNGERRLLIENTNN